MAIIGNKSTSSAHHPHTMTTPSKVTAVSVLGRRSPPGKCDFYFFGLGWETLPGSIDCTLSLTLIIGYLEPTATAKNQSTAFSRK
jgi:hypothetical protein